MNYQQPQPEYNPDPRDMYLKRPARKRRRKPNQLQNQPNGLNYESPYNFQFKGSQNIIS